LLSMDGLKTTIAEITTKLDAVDAALARIDAGAYGNCVVCSQPIEDAVLAIDATATNCSSHPRLSEQ
ncbi:MAG: hypothetical protein WCJ28_03880, partial [Actinomycetota bacterium]